MGGGASSVAKSNELSISKDKRDVLLPLNNLANHAKVYIHNETGEILVVVDDSIGNFVANVADWQVHKMSTRQLDYYNSLQVSVVAKHMLSADSKPPSMSTLMVENSMSNMVTDESLKTVEYSKVDRKVDSDSKQMHEAVNKSRHKGIAIMHTVDDNSHDVDRSESLDYRADEKSHSRKELNVTADSKSSHRQQIQRTQPKPYLPPSNGLYHNDMTNDTRMHKASQSFVSSSAHYSRSVRSAAAVMSSGHISPRLARTSIECKVCGETFPNTNSEMAEEHMADCESKSELRKGLLEIDHNLGPAVEELSKSNSRQLEDLLQRALIRVSEEMEEMGAMNRAVQRLVRRVLRISPSSTFDGRSMDSLTSDVDRLLSTVQQRLSDSTDEIEQKELQTFNIVLKDTRNQLKEKILLLSKHNRTQLTAKDFQFIRTIGKGAFGSVYLAQRKDKFCAIKVMSKSAIRKADSVLQILRERKALSLACKYPDSFVRLQCGFQRGDNLFLVMEYMPGGDCMTLMGTMTANRLPECAAQHIIAQVCMAVKHLHFHGVVHRDIKPDNVLITSRGHAKLGDFGLVMPFTRSAQDGINRLLSTSGSGSVSSPRGAGMSPGKTSRSLSDYSSKGSNKSGMSNELWLEDDSDIVNNSPTGLNGKWSRESSSSIFWNHPDEQAKLVSPVGNYNYACPEMVEGMGYDHTVDWWSVGVMMFHLLAGLTPFHSDAKEETLAKEQTLVNIRQHDQQGAQCGVQWHLLPREISEDCIRFISDIITKRSVQRLGYVSTEQVLQHVYFRDIDWDTLYVGLGPYYPLVEGATGKEFHCFTTLTLAESQVPNFLEDGSDDAAMGEDSEDMFLNFTYFG